ncbi:MAG: SMP-30/gluconolactonase/LRE family protein [Bacteroidales bacterium]|nr:MAG: SMP-30/gluconolactonase/LRE family protein [Bacteroidales bacterium]
MKYLTFVFLSIAIIVTGCKNMRTKEPPEATDSPEKKYQTTGEVERLSKKLDKIIPADALPEILAEGFEWSEGPLWLPDQKMVIFSDIPVNSIFKWDEDGGLELYLKPSGYTDTVSRSGESGSNGLLLDNEGRLVLCQHGDRRMARMDAGLDNPEPVFTTLSGMYNGKRLNSPNDAVYNSKNELFFTDPPYGLEQNVDDSTKELDFQGVYKVTPGGETVLLTDELSRPNGIAFSPDETKIYIANSDPANAIWMVYDVIGEGTLANGRIFLDATEQAGKERGLPDGLKVDDQGNLFATGPGGVWVISPEGEHLGTIKTGEATSNCAFNEDKSILFITADMYLMRIKLK